MAGGGRVAGLTTVSGSVAGIGAAGLSAGVTDTGISFCVVVGGVKAGVAASMLGCGWASSRHRYILQRHSIIHA